MNPPISITLPIDPADPSHIDLVRIMAAVNDLQRANRCAIAEEIKAPPGISPVGFDQDSRNYHFYFIRLACGHLAEGLGAFRKFLQNPSAMSIIGTWTDNKKKVFDELLLASDRNNPNSFFKKELSQIRVDTAFHYPFGAFQEEIERSVSSDPVLHYPAEIISGQTYAEAHYTYADTVLVNIFYMAANRNIDDFKLLIQRISNLQYALVVFVDAYVSELV